MNNSTCFCRWTCTLLAVIASVIIGITTALLTITGTITVTPAFLWVLFGIAVVYLAIALIVSALNCRNTDGCICSSLAALLTGILGTVLTSVILLAITFPVTSILGAAITGLLLLFFTLILTATACIIRCFSHCTNI